MAFAVQWARLANGLELPYVTQGDPSGPSLVCLHGFAESWRSFELVLAELPPEIRAFSLSLRGHGGPRTLAAEYSLRAIASDVAAFMDAVGIEAAVVAGSSSGGYVAQQLAVDRPDRVRGLALLGSPRSLRDVPAVGELTARLNTFDEQIDAAFMRAFNAGALARPAPEAFLEAMIGEGIAVPPDVWRATLAALADATPPTEAATIRVPTLIVWGDRDPFVPSGDAEALRNAIPGAELVTYAGTGHMPAWEEPARVAADIARLFDRLYSR